MKELSKVLILLFIVLMGTASCGDEPDGSWEKMKWTNATNLMNVNGVYILPAEGGSCSFLCRNYSHPWISSVEVNGVYQAVDSENPLVFNGEWFTLKFEGNNLIITAEPLPESVQSRSFKLDVTAGDIFDHFVFSQQRNT